MPSMVPTNIYTISIAPVDASDTIGSYINLGCVLGVEEVPAIEAQFKEFLCSSNNTRALEYAPTHYTRGMMRWKNKWGDGTYTLLKGYAGLSGSSPTNQFQRVAIKMEIGLLDATATRPTAVWKGYIKSCKIDPWPDNRDLHQITTEFQADSDATWTSLPSALT